MENPQWVLFTYASSRIAFTTPQTWKLKTHDIALKKDHTIMCKQKQGKKIVEPVVKLKT